MKIKFIKDPFLPRDMAYLGYRKDQIVDLEPWKCERWLKRGVAEVVVEIEKVSPKVKAAALNIKTDFEPEAKSVVEKPLVKETQDTITESDNISDNVFNSNERTIGLSRSIPKDV